MRGRLAVVEELSASGATLRLLPMSFKNSPFRYPHALLKPEPGAVYTADEMADDLNSDKFLEACRNARHNHLYAWLSDPEEGKRPRAVRPKRLRDAQEIARLAARAQQPHGLTGAQAEVIGSHLEERVLVLQGPPGTARAHARLRHPLALLAQATPARPSASRAGEDARRRQRRARIVARRTRQSGRVLGAGVGFGSNQTQNQNPTPSLAPPRDSKSSRSATTRHAVPDGCGACCPTGARG